MLSIRQSARIVTRLSSRRAYSTSTQQNASNSKIGSRTLATVVVTTGGIIGGWYSKGWLDSRRGTTVSDSRFASHDAPRLDHGVGRYPLQFPTPPSPVEVTKLLTEEAYSSEVKGIDGVKRYYGTRLQSNGPTEDYFIHGKFESPWEKGKNWMAWGVFDGHA